VSIESIESQSSEEGSGDIAESSPEFTDPRPAAGGEPSSEPSVVAVERTPTRLSATWTAVVVAVVMLVALVIFIAQNTQQSMVNFLGAHGKAPTSVVLLIAAIAGALIVIIVGIARILQLRRITKHAKSGSES
jgi:uncharacterized integral membrane protein